MSHPTDGRPCILAADDDAQIRRFLEVLLGRHAVTVKAAASGSEAIDLYRAHRDEIALVLLDVQMPGLDGPGVLVRLQALNPAERCWFMSGDTGSYSERDLIELGACGLLAKPLALAALGAVLASIGIATEGVIAE